MSVSKSQLLSTGAALRHAQKQGVNADDIRRVTIDGTEVDTAAAHGAVDALTQAINAAEAQAKQAEVQQKAGDKPPSNVFARAWSSVASGVSNSAREVGAWTSDNVVNPTGAFFARTMPATTRRVRDGTQAAMKVADTDPEHVQNRATVLIETKDGRSLAIPVFVDDTATSAVLRGISLVSGASNLVPIPLVGAAVQGGTALLSALASGVSHMAGNDRLGASLWQMAKKHAVMGAVGAIPVVGTVTAAVTLKDLHRLRADVRIDELVCAAPEVDASMNLPGAAVSPKPDNP